MCRAIGTARRRVWSRPGEGVLTHCNAGGLATADYGTALAVIFAAHEQGKHVHVFADETRPLLQGARLTAWELPAPGHPRHPDLRQHGRPGDEGGQDPDGHRRRRPHRRQRRHRQQDRHLRRRRAGPGARHPVLRRRALEHVRPRPSPTAPPSRSSSATPARSPTASAARPPRRASTSTTPPSTSPPPS